LSRKVSVDCVVAGAPRNDGERLSQDTGLLETCSAIFKHSRHRQSSQSIGIGRRTVSSAHQHGPAGLQMNSVPQRGQARRREA